jgi:hypothetical protein
MNHNRLVPVFSLFRDIPEGRVGRSEGAPADLDDERSAHVW